MRRLVESAHVGRLATVAADGRPHAVPVCYVLVGDVVYSAVDHKPKRSRHLRRVANVQATGRACLLVDVYDEDWTRLWWVRVDGPARVVEDPAEAHRGIDALVAKYRQYAERRPSGPVLAVEAQAWSGWTSAPSRESR